MREIKFQAWDKTTNTMVAFDLKDIQLNLFSVRELASRNNWSNPIVQFTGLQDKNGKEIYEGDIVKNHLDFIDRVVWNPFPKMAGFQVNHYGIDIFDAQSIEIIGNIYENPELIDKT